jgi:hypothetical protein
MRYAKFKSLFARSFGRRDRQGTDQLEREVEAEIRRYEADLPPPVGPSEAYWQNLPITINQRIDGRTSGRALSKAWAARVALPGVVTMLVVLAVLRIYAPESRPQVQAVNSVVMALPSEVVDSLLADPTPIDPSLTVEDWPAEVFDVSRDQMTEYLVDNGATSDVVNDLTSKESTALFAALESHH